MQNNDLNQIRIFTQVAHFQSFTKAAQVLELEKSTVSTKINQLETRLGIRLLQRTTRSVSLTEAGSQYLAYCEQALEALQMGDDFISSLQDQPAGRLRVNAPQDFVNFSMSSLFVPFLKQYPDVKLEVIQSSQDIDLIKENIDVSVRSSQTEIQDSSLIYRKIYQSEWILVASPQHIEKYGLPESPQALIKQPSVGLLNENSNFQYNNFLHWENEKINIQHRFSVNNAQGIIQAVKAGLGFAMIPKNMIRGELEKKQLIEINKDVKISPTSLYVVYPSRAGQPAMTRAFVDALIIWSENYLNHQSQAMK